MLPAIVYNTKAIIEKVDTLWGPFKTNSGGEEMAKNERTSKRVGKIASKLLKSKKTSKKVKGVAGSALTQRPDRKSKMK